jgi:ADP-heptose:LPS heptosyltransferase
VLQARPGLHQVVRRAQEVRAPGQPFGGVRRLAVVRNDRLGDLVLTLPAVAALRAAYPSAWLALVVRPATAPLARIVEGVDEVIEDDGRPGTLHDALALFRPDLLVAIAPGGRTSWAALRARVPHRVGTGYRLYSPMFERTVDERRSAGARHEAEYALAFAHRAGAPGGAARFPIRVPDTASESLAAWLGEHQVPERWVVLHPGSGGSCPAWPAGHFVRLAALLRAEGVPVVFSVGPTDETIARALDDAPAQVRRAARFAGDLPTLAALLGRSAVVVSNSTGPLHLAAACGAPTLAFHAPWPTCGVARWGPYAENGWGLVAELPEALAWSATLRRERGEELLSALSPATALACVLSLLESGRPTLP